MLKCVFSSQVCGYTVILVPLQVATEKDFLDAIQKVIKAYAKFSSTPRYMTYN